MTWRIAAAAAFGLALTSACQSPSAGVLVLPALVATPALPAATPGTPSARRGPDAAIQARTEVPQRIGGSLRATLLANVDGASSLGLVDVPQPMLVQRNMLAVSEVVRPHADVRRGPGAQFELADVVLPQGAKVLVFAQVGVWQQVVVPGQWQRGWVHRQALGAARLNDQTVALDLSKLPTVLAMHPVDSAAAFPDQAPLKVAIPKGEMFRSLMMNGSDALVWLPETRSVMWLSRKDVQ